MKYTLSFLLFLLAAATVTVPATGQHADARIGALLNSGDYFTLREVLPRQADSIASPVVRGMAETLVGTFFNRPADALTAVSELLETYGDELGPDNATSMVFMALLDLFMLDRYAAAAELTNDFIADIDGSLPDELLFSLEFFRRTGHALAGRPAPELVMPEGGTCVPYRLDSVGRGRIMTVPVHIGGNVRDFVFDTGAAQFNFVSERFARENGIRMIADSIPVAGIGRGWVGLGVADSLAVGGIVMRNPVFLISPPDQVTDTIEVISAVLGNAFMRKAERFTIDNRTRHIVFPAERTLHADGTERMANMMLNSFQPYVRIHADGIPLLFHFDTGNVATTLYPPYYELFREQVDSCGVEDTVRIGGFAGVAENVCYRLPSVEFTLEGIPFTLRDIDVLPSGSAGATAGSEAGSLGTDFATAFDTLTVDYTSCTVRGENVP